MDSTLLPLKEARVCRHGNLQASSSHQQLLSHQQGCAHTHMHVVPCPVSPPDADLTTHAILPLLTLACSVTASVLFATSGVQSLLLTRNNMDSSVQAATKGPFRNHYWTN